MKTQQLPQNTGNPFRIYKRGDQLRKHSQYEERKFYLSRILLAVDQPERSRPASVNANSRTINSEGHIGKELRPVIEPLKGDFPRRLFDATEEIRKRREIFWKQYQLDSIDISQRRELVSSNSRRPRPQRLAAGFQLHSRYKSLAARSKFGIFR